MNENTNTLSTANKPTEETTPERWAKYVAYNARLCRALIDELKLYGPEVKSLNDGRYALLWLSIASCITTRIPAPKGWTPRKLNEEERKMIYAYLTKATQLQLELEKGELPFDQKRMKKSQVRFLFFLMESALESEKMWLEKEWLEMF